MTDLMYREQALLELIIECIEDSKEKIDVMVPSRDYYARPGDCHDSTIEIVSPYRFIEALKERLK